PRSSIEHQVEDPDVVFGRTTGSKHGLADELVGGHGPGAQPTPSIDPRHRVPLCGARLREEGGATSSVDPGVKLGELNGGVAPIAPSRPAAARVDVETGEPGQGRLGLGADFSKRLEVLVTTRVHADASAVLEGIGEVPNPEGIELDGSWALWGVQGDDEQASAEPGVPAKQALEVGQAEQRPPQHQPHATDAEDQVP